MSDLHTFFGPNAGYVLELYDRYLADPTAVDPESRAFFAHFTPTSRNGVAAPGGIVNVAAVVGAAGLTRAIREFGHLAVQLDPLGGRPHGAPELEPGFHGISEDDLRPLPAAAVPSQAALDAANAAEAIARLRAIYSRNIGYDFDHVQIAEEREWLLNAVEGGSFRQPLDTAAKRQLLDRLTKVEAFEKFLHQTYLGQKRFSVEGSDMLIPMLDAIVHDAAVAGIKEIVLGMAHRGRLNALTHILGKPYETLIAAFEGGTGHAGTAASDANEEEEGFTSDVKYHLGATLARTPDGKTVEVPIVLVPNPSHLEFVNPVVEGMVRAAQDQRDQAGPPPRDPMASMAILLHGDAAFPGQGIVAETLNLSGLPGYTTGGTVHIIVNNQIGFTTDVVDSRSTLFAGDLAKGFEIPIVHVNADDPEACVVAAHLAAAYRQQFAKDFLIDLVGYRRWGHNEGDEPTFTQPRMYAVVTKHSTVRQRWGAQLVAEGVVEPDEPDRMLASQLDHLADIRRSMKEQVSAPAPENGARGMRREVETAVPLAKLREFHDDIHALPPGFGLSQKLLRQWERRRDILDAPGGKVDWAHAETLAFAAILSDGTPIRLSGQDAERGTFSQRHLVLHDAVTGVRHVPLQTLPAARASFAVYNSPLSEAATVGFEYGYTVHAPKVLVIWEAQFGDFANGAQVLIDQFVVAARAKWRQEPALVMLLPHGYEGQGPEHSSARLERFLQLSAEENLRVANCTTAAQYFHLLRRQATLLADDRHPLILMTPKSLLREPLAASTLADLATGTFRPVLDDPLRADNPAAVTRLMLCSGKIAVELEKSEARRTTPHVAIARVEQLAPFQNSALRGVLDHYPSLAQVMWVQEEPHNMGAWSFMEPRLRALLDELKRPLPVAYVGRPERASPAEGAADLHHREHTRIVAAAFANVPPLNGSTGDGRGTIARPTGAPSTAQAGLNGPVTEVTPATAKTTE